MGFSNDFDWRGKKEELIKLDKVPTLSHLDDLPYAEVEDNYTKYKIHGIVHSDTKGASQNKVDLFG